jgi:hypothetical protein
MDPPAAASPKSSPSLGNPRSDSILFGAAWRANRISEDRERTELHRDSDYPPGLSISPIAISIIIIIIIIIIIAILWLAGVHQDRNGGYRAAF